MGRRAHHGERTAPVRQGCAWSWRCHFAVLIVVWTGSGHGPLFRGSSAASATPSWRDGLVSGVFLAGTALAALLDRRRHGRTAQPAAWWPGCWWPARGCS